MDYRSLGASGLKVPVLSLGTGTFGGANHPFFKTWGTTEVDEAKRLVDMCLDVGLTMFDSADNYSGGAAEEILGKAVAGKRDKVLISTKATFRSGPGANDIGSSRHYLIRAAEKTLKRLGTDYIDLWQMHGFDAATPVEETLSALDDLVRAGKVRYIGCSNFSGWHLMKSLSASDRYGWARYIAHQAYYSLISREYEWELMPLALDQNVGTTVWSPLAGGKLTGKIGRDKKAPEGSRTAAMGLGQDVTPEQFFNIVDALEAVAAETGHTVSQVALNWVLHRPSVATVIVGARNEAQLKENLGAVEFRLTAEQVHKLDRASDRRPVYPYWHQRMTIAERNPPPVAPPPKL